MYKCLTFFSQLTYLSLFLCIASCSNKNNEILNSKYTDYSNKINTVPLIDESRNNINESVISKNLNNTVNITHFDKLENIISDNIQEDNINGWFVPKDVKILNQNFHYSSSLRKDGKLIPVSNVFLVDTVPHYFTSFEFYKRFFSNFEILGYSIFIYNKSLNCKYIERLAKAKGANLVILKKIHNREKENYIYDILYLKGNIYYKDFYWMRSSKEAIPINITLETIEKNKKELSKSYLTSSLRIKNVESYSNSEPVIEYKANTVFQPLNENIDSFFNLMQVTDDNDVSSDSPIDTMDKSYKTLEDRVNNVVGLWMDSYDKTIVRIQEISSDKVKKYDEKAFDSTKIKYYGAYIEFKDEEEMRKYNSCRNINNDEKLLWHNNDLKFQFNSSGNKGVFLNYNKMPVPVIIKTFPIKGVLMVNLPNGEIRYYIPVDVTDIKPELLKKLYSKLPPYVKGKETCIGNDVTYTGYGLYGWLIYTGLIILGLGIISFI